MGATNPQNQGGQTHFHWYSHQSLPIDAEAGDRQTYIEGFFLASLSCLTLSPEFFKNNKNQTKAERDQLGQRVVRAHSWECPSSCKRKIRRRWRCMACTPLSCLRKNIINIRKGRQKLRVFVRYSPLSSFRRQKMILFELCRIYAFLPPSPSFPKQL